LVKTALVGITGVGIVGVGIAGASIPAAWWGRLKLATFNK